MKRLGTGILFGFAGYLIAALAGYLFVEMLSGNTHDRDVEAAMTSIFFIGPMGGIAGFIVGIVWGRRFSSASSN